MPHQQQPRTLLPSTAIEAIPLTNPRVDDPRDSSTAWLDSGADSTGPAMASLPSSPTVATAALQRPLTPRSKIQALMARVDADEDLDSDADTNHASRHPVVTAPRVPLAEVNSNRGLKDGSLEHNMKRGEVVGAEQRTTSRMLSDQEDSDSAGENLPLGTTAYQRIRAQMQNGKFKSPLKTAPVLDRAQDQSETGSDDDDETEDEIIPRGRMAARLKSRGPQAPSPPPHNDLAAESVKDRYPQRQSPIAASNASEALQSSPPSAPATAPRLGRFLLRKKLQATSPGPSESEPAASDAVTERNANASDSDRELNEAPNARFLELVARKREERQVREAAEEERQRERMARIADEVAADADRLPIQKTKGKHVRLRTGAEQSDEDDDPLSSQKLEQASRPARKASKKALEEMSKETQRISRNMQLAHEARTKKKITKESLLQRFNFRVVPPTIPAAAPATSSSAPQSDDEGSRDHHTPPTSPVSATRLDMEKPETAVLKTLPAVNPTTHDAAAEVASNADSDHLSLDDLLTIQAAPVDIPQPVAQAGPQRALYHETRAEQAGHTKGASASAIKDFVHSRRCDSGSDSDLEIISPKRSALLATFERVKPLANKGTEGRAMKTLRVLAHIGSPNGKSRGAMVGTTPAALQFSLRKKAREQAARERAEKIQDLRDRGVIVRTEEEREREQVEIEDMLEKARKENEELARKEKSAAKKEALANGEDLPSSDEDEDYQAGDEDADEQNELQLSGSEDEEEIDLSGSEDEEENEEEEGDENGVPSNGLFDDQAQDASGEESEAENDEPEAALEIEDEDTPVLPRKARRAARIVDDDEEEDLPTMTQDTTVDLLTKDPFAATTSPKNPFMAAMTAAPMGLTQAFAATMADSQDQSPPTEELDSLARLEPLPDPDFLGAVLDSYPLATQDQDSGLQVDLNFPQSQLEYETFRDPAEPQPSEMPEPTQDVGFGMSSPVKDRFGAVPPSTADTVLVGDAASQPRAATRKGRLQRGRRAATFSDEDDDEEADDESDALSLDDEFAVNADAFNIMKRAAQRAKKHEDDFDKKKSEAKDMVEEQAQESEDEYAGIGGASDDESGSEMDEEVQQMIDESKVNVNERQLAAFHA